MYGTPVLLPHAGFTDWQFAIEHMGSNTLLNGRLQI